ncbi:MAG: SDR family NAD(P)-dependent oxidoreductase, partial [Wenzhouxiangella sp.]
MSDERNDSDTLKDGNQETAGNVPRRAGENSRPLALVTGASAGIGAEFARQLAAAGYDLVLTARRRERLDELAEKLRDEHGSECLVVPADLTDPEAPRQLCEAIEQAGRTVTLLVNNAGYAVPGHYNHASWEQQAAFLQIMVTAVAELSHRLLPGMRQTGYGGIINVASLAGIVAGSSGHTLYGAVKSFMIGLSESLAMENRSAGLKIQALCPGFTYSEFHDVSGTRDIVSRMPSYMWMNADEVVRISLDRFADSKAPVMLVPGRWNRFVAMLARKLP